MCTWELAGRGAAARARVFPAAAWQEVAGLMRPAAGAAGAAGAAAEGGSAGGGSPAGGGGGGGAARWLADALIDWQQLRLLLEVSRNDRKVGTTHAG